MLPAWFNYRRNRVPGGTYFFTVTLADRSATTLVDHIDHLRAAVRGVRAKHPFTLCAMVVLPDHLHAVLRLPEGDDRYSMRWRMIKTDFTVRLRKQGIEFGERGNGERRLWARRFWEHTIRDQQSLAHKMPVWSDPLRQTSLERRCSHAGVPGFAALYPGYGEDWGERYFAISNNTERPCNP